MNAAFIRPAGGFGDLLGCLAAIRMFKARNPEIECDLFAPLPYASAAYHNTDLRHVHEIRQAGGAVQRNYFRRYAYQEYDLVFDLLGPESRYEGKTSPGVDKTRIDMWCEYIGFAHDGLTLPRYEVTRDEFLWATWYLERRRIPYSYSVGIQVQSANPAKDWPYQYSIELAYQLADDGKNVYLFGNRIPEYPEADGVHACRNLTWRETAALASMMDIIVCPDSSFHHLAGALYVPQVTLFGPTDAWLDPHDLPGGLDFLHPLYQHCLVLQPSAPRGCCCWFTKIQDCDFGRHRGPHFPAPCMFEVTVPQVFDAVNAMLERPHAETTD